MSAKPYSVRQYPSQHNSQHNAAGQPQQGFSSLEQLLRQHSIERSAAVSTHSFIRRAVPNISELNPDHKRIEDFLMDVEPWRSAKFLVTELRHADSVEPVLRVLAHYGASENTVKPLIGALGDDDEQVVSAAKKALIGYGRTAREFIKTPDPSIPSYMQNPIHRQLTEVIAAINSGQSGGVR